MSLFETRDLSRRFGTGGARVDALRGVSLKVEPGEMLAIMGPSGCGKTTLLNVLGLIDPGYDGELLVEGRSASVLSETGRTRLRLTSIGFVFQSFNLIGGLTVRANVALPKWYVEKNRKAAFKRADALLEEMGLAERGNHYPAQLSAGEQQRAAVARALENEPRAIIADEPSAHLDEAATHQLAALLASLAEGGRAVVVASHDTVLAGFANRTVRLRFGEIVQADRGASNVAGRGSEVS